MFGMLSKGLAVAAIIGWGLWYYESIQHKKTIAVYAGQVEGLQSDNRVLADAVESQKASYDALLAQRQEDRLARVRIDMEYAAITKERDESKAKLESYRSRWSNVAHEKPKALARLINSATRKRVQRLYTGTCRANCGEDRNKNNSNGTTKEASTDSGI